MREFIPGNLTRFVLVVIFLLLAVNPVQAQDCASFDGNREGFWVSLQDHVESACFRALVDGWKDRKLPAGDDGKALSANIVAGWEQVMMGLEAVRETVDTFQSTLDGRARIAGDPTGRLIARTELALDELKTIANEKPFSKKSVWDMDWRAIGGLPAVRLDSDKAVQDEIALRDFLERLCAAEAERNSDNACPQVSAAAHSLMYSLSLALELGAASGVDTINRVATQVAAIDREWDQFLLQGKPMYWLDLLATDLFADYGNADGGFKRPPKYQLFFMHPAAALSYIEDAPDGEQLVPSVYLEVIGVNKWRSKHFSGVSVIAAYSDNASTDDVGYGLLFTWNSKYSFGVVKYDDDTAISVSIDLANAYREKLKPQLEAIKQGL